MKNVIALGLVACAALFNVQTVKADVVNDVEMWRLTCSDHNTAWWNWLEKSNGYKKLKATNNADWERKDVLHREYIDKCAQYMSTYNMDKDSQDPVSPGLQAFHNGYVKEFEAKLAAVGAEPKAQPKPTVKSYYIMDVLNTPALKSQLVQCEASPDAARVIAQIRSDMQEAKFQYQQEVQFLRDNGMDGFAANKQAAQTILDPANENAKFNTERADKFVNKCLSQNYGWTFHN